MKRRTFIHRSAVAGLAGMSDVTVPSAVTREGRGESDVMQAYTVMVGEAFQ